MKPGVQIPHCSGGVLEEFLLQRVQPVRRAMPSMVVMDLPSASTASTRQELTSTPSRMTLHAPQLPLLQPSLAPVRPSSIAQHFQQALARLAQELDRFAVDAWFEQGFF